MEEAGEVDKAQAIASEAAAFHPEAAKPKTVADLAEATSAAAMRDRAVREGLPVCAVAVLEQAAAGGGSETS